MLQLTKYACHIPNGLMVVPKSFRLLYYSSIRSYVRGRKKKTCYQLKPITFTIPNYMSVNNLSNTLNVKINQLMNDLKQLGFKNVTSNYILTREYIELILQEYNYELPHSTVSITSDTLYNQLRSPIDPTKLNKRPPIVTIMGHVDHGKTTILDYLRKSSIVSQEHGGITQHIGAFQVETPISKRKITFLDTPGHAAFLKMRERGSIITDSVILVVSIEDSIMPQTLEAIKHVKSSGNELIVAITKIDKISSKKDREKAINKITNDLISHDVPIETIGGDVQVIPISAKSGENMDLLEESIVILSDVMDLKSEQGNSTMVEGWILESKVRKSLGNVSTVLIKKGDLHRGDVLICGNTFCKVRALLDENGNKLSKVSPSQAAEVTGWKELPNAGDEVIQVKDEATAKKFVTKRQLLLKLEQEVITVDKMNDKKLTEVTNVSNKIDSKENDLNGVFDNTNGPRKINFIVKADVSGSIEAIVESLFLLKNEEVAVNIISSSVGIPNENDLKMARITSSTILCFNLSNLPNDVINNKEHVKIEQFNVIYNLIERVMEILTENLKPIYEIKQLATADIREIFNFSLKKKIIRIAGCRVTNGKLTRNSLIKVVRGNDENVIYEGKLSTLKQGKETVTEINKGNDCGVTFEDNFEGYEAGDKIIVYEKVRIPRYF